MRYLDAGCGVGRYIGQRAQQQAGEYFGVDIDPANIKIAAKNYPAVNFEVMSVENLKFPDSYFDIVWSRDVLEHVDNLQVTAREMARVLVRGGKLVVKVPAARSERWLLRVRPTYFKEIHHVRIFEGTQVEDLFSTLGLKLVKKQPQAFFDHFFLYFLFKSSKASETQIALGSWKQHWWGWFVAPIHAYMKPELVFDTWLKYVPIWLVTLPVGYIVNLVGNQFMPKSWYYEFIKK